MYNEHDTIRRIWEGRLDPPEAPEPQQEQCEHFQDYVNCKRCAFKNQFVGKDCQIGCEYYEQRKW